MKEELDHLRHRFELYKKIALEKPGREDHDSEVTLDKSVLRDHLEALKRIDSSQLSKDDQKRIGELSLYLKSNL
jgi:hypothetical protein